METRLTRIERAIGLAIRTALLITLVFIAWILWYDIITGRGIYFNVGVGFHEFSNSMNLNAHHFHRGEIGGSRCAP